MRLTFLAYEPDRLMLEPNFTGPLVTFTLWRLLPRQTHLTRVSRATVTRRDAAVADEVVVADLDPLRRGERGRGRGAGEAGDEHGTSSLRKGTILRW